MSKLAVRFRPEVSPQDIEALEHRHGLAAVGGIPALRIRYYDVPRELTAALEAETAVEYVEEEQDLKAS